MLHTFLKENAVNELADLNLTLDDYETPRQVKKQISDLQETLKATVLINRILWIILAAIAIPCLISIIQEFAELAPLYSDAAIKGCLASLLGFTIMLFYYQDKKNRLARKLMMLNLLISKPCYSALPELPVLLEQ